MVIKTTETETISTPIDIKYYQQFKHPKINNKFYHEKFKSACGKAAAGRVRATAL